MQNIQDYVRRTASAAKQASYIVAAAETAQKNAALLRAAELIRHHQTAILAANAQDMEQAAQKGLNDALLDRLRLTEKTIDAMCEGLRQIAALPDPVGEMDEFRTRENGLQIGKMRVPLGVVGIIYESRPNVTVDAAALCLKSGNACVLRGGSEAFNSNMALSKLITQALIENGLPATAVSLIENTDRESVGAMLQSPEFIDVVIPRGGKSLVSRIAAEARVPVIKHLDGICHVYIDRAADAEKAVNIAFNAKTSRYGTCNTMETLLVHQSRAAEILPVLAGKYAARDVELRGCPPRVTPAGGKIRCPGCRAARLPAYPFHPAPHSNGLRRRLGHRIPRPDPLRQNRRQPRRGRRPHQHPRQPPHRQHRNRILHRRPQLPAHGRQRQRHGQCLHPLR